MTHSDVAWAGNAPATNNPDDDTLTAGAGQFVPVAPGPRVPPVQPGVPQQPQAGRGRPKGLVIALSIATAVSILLGAVMTVAYVREHKAKTDLSQTSADLRRTSADRNAQVATLTTQLAQARNAVGELEARAVAVGGYDTVKSCVDQVAAIEALLVDAMQTANEQNQQKVGEMLVRLALSKVCSNAKPYLK